MTLSLPAPAKLNMILHILGRREDGYHQLQTLFQLLDWGDTLHFSTNHSGQITLQGPDLGIPSKDNLIVRAAKLLQQGDLGVDIELDKRIPTGGGLGGGSSDAATTLVALNHLWQCGYSTQQLAKMGRQLGADVPVFVAGYSAWAEGTGEQLSPVEIPPAWYLVLFPNCEISTAEIFSQRQLTRNSSPITMAAFFEGGSRNDCQKTASSLYPEVDKALNWLGNFGEAKLTGTGACIFARFDTEDDAQGPLGQLPEQWSAVVARGVNRSPLHTALD
jgi:4-diphosphocytidyl-2-C-methyl-D-erythritol kinase